MSEVRLERMTWPEAREALRFGKVAVVPVGSTEQHGYHLPLSTDTMNVYALAQLAAERCGKAIVAPPVPYGTAHNHMNFPGTITLRLDTLKALLFDVAESLIKHGFHRVILLNGHGGNLSAVAAAAEEVREAYPQCRLGVVYTPALSKGTKGVFESHIEWHADESETSVTLALNGEWVHMERAVNEQPKPTTSKFFRFTEDALTNSVVNYGLPKTDTLSDSGTIGDARLATRAKGEVVVAEAVRVLCEVLEEVASEGPTS